MASDHGEIRVFAEQRHTVPYRHGCDQAIGQLARRLAADPTAAVEVSRLLVVGGTIDWEKLNTGEEPAQPIAVVVVPSAGKDLHHDHIGARQRVPMLQCRTQAQVRGAAGGAQELDPSGAVDEDHGG